MLDKSVKYTTVLRDDSNVYVYGHEVVLSDDEVLVSGLNSSVVARIVGNKVEKYDYSDYGKNDKIVKGYGYNGEYKDESGLVYLRARYYDPILGRFVQIDKNYAGEKDIINSQNRYTYTINNPYKYVDRDGNKPLIDVPGIDKEQQKARDKNFAYNKIENVKATYKLTSTEVTNLRNTIYKAIDNGLLWTSILNNYLKTKNPKPTGGDGGGRLIDCTDIENLGNHVNTYNDKRDIIPVRVYRSGVYEHKYNMFEPENQFRSSFTEEMISELIATPNEDDAITALALGYMDYLGSSQKKYSDFWNNVMSLAPKTKPFSGLGSSGVIASVGSTIISKISYGAVLAAVDEFVKDARFVEVINSYIGTELIVSLGYKPAYERVKVAIILPDGRTELVLVKNEKVTRYFALDILKGDDSLISSNDKDKTRYNIYCIVGDNIDTKSDYDYARKALSLYMSGNGFWNYTNSSVRDELFDYETTMWWCKISR